MKDHLFRSAVFESRRKTWLGNIVMVQPLSIRCMTIFAVCGSAILVLFLFFGSYTRRTTVTGELVPDSGIVKIFGPQGAIVIGRHVIEGQEVKAGDILYELTSERRSDSVGDIQATIGRLTETRRKSLLDELAKTKQVQMDERLSLDKKIRSLENELKSIDSQIAMQMERVDVVKKTEDSYQDLVGNGFVSQEFLNQKHGETLDQKSRLKAFERDRQNISRELSDRAQERATASLRNENQLAQIERSIASVSEEFSENEVKRSVVIAATQSGVISTLLADIGQSVDSSKPLLTLIPTGATLRANLYAPSKAVGFVTIGDEVMLRYQAYPFQKFGHHKGIVSAVARIALPSGDLSTSIEKSSSEPLYRITVVLESQTILAYGKEQPLQVGMLLDADILLEKRRLYEWVLEPLYVISGRI